MYDIIGDIHGHATLLKKLLVKLGYSKVNGSFSHPKRKVVFVGDFINRGPEIRKTVRIVRAMVDAGNAYAILGNHEINLIIYHLKDKEGRKVVAKPSKYFLSLFKTINDYASSPAEWKEHLKWLRTLPLYLDLGGIRVVHACWSDNAIELAKSVYVKGKIKKKVFQKVYKKSDSDISRNVWLITKGVSLKMPSDLKITNNKGVSPRSIRVRWWERLENRTFEDISFESKFKLPEYTVPNEILPEVYPYPKDAPILFMGHYCRGRGPSIVKPNVCCVDACIVGTKTLLAYRWSGEKKLKENNLVKIKD